MPRLTWDKNDPKEVAAALAAHRLYTKHRFVAKVDGKVVRIFDATLGHVDFEPGPTAFDRVMQENDPWE